MLKQFLNLVVYTATTIRVRRTIPQDGKSRHKGIIAETDGDIALKRDSRELMIFVSKKIPLDHPIISLKLPKEIANFFGPRGENMYRVIIAADVKYIEEVLRTEGVPELSAAPWYEDFLATLERTEPALFHRYFELVAGSPIPLKSGCVLTDERQLAAKLSTLNLGKVDEAKAGWLPAIPFIDNDDYTGQSLT